VIDNIPFVAAMIPIILGLETQGVNVAPLWWGLALGAGIGGLGSHVGSAVNVFIVSLSERIAKQTGDHSLAITPGLWLRKATPAAVASLIVISILLYSFFPFFEAPFAKVAAHNSEILISAE
jgi:Na+/H+ antiporter NhaD/arsenite permease-like protein